MREKIRYGMVGCGVIAARHAASAKRCEGAALVAVADLDRSRAEAFAAEHGVAEVYGDARAMIGEGEVDAVVLAMPVRGRAGLVRAAIEAGRHVLVEKPAGQNAAEVAGLVAASASAGVKAAGCSSRHSGLGSARAAAAVVASGRLGSLRVVRGRAVLPAGEQPNADPPVWRVRHDLNGGGILSNWGVYDLDYLLSVTNWTLRPESVLAQVWPVSQVYGDYVHADSNAETHAVALVRCVGGTVITLERGEFLAVQQETAWELIGERGSLRMNLLPGDGVRVELSEAGPGGRGVVQEVVFEGQETWDDVHDLPLHDLTDAILNDREPATSLRRAYGISAICDAIYASSASGQCEPVATLT